jgi:hypothetical protein
MGRAVRKRSIHGHPGTVIMVTHADWADNVGYDHRELGATLREVAVIFALRC